MRKARKKSGLDTGNLRDRAQQWRGYIPQIKASLGSHPDPVQLVIQVWRGSDLGRRYFRRRMWTLYRWRLGLEPEEQAGPPFSISADSSLEEIDIFGDAVKTLLQWGLLDSLHNTLAQVQEEALSRQNDVFPPMYQALVYFLEHRVPTLRIVSQSVWNMSDAIDSASGFGAAASKGLVASSYTSLRQAIARDYPNVTDGLLSELTGEFAEILLSRLREAESGTTPGAFDIYDATKKAFSNIRKGMSEPSIPRSVKSLRRLTETQNAPSVEAEALGRAAAEDLTREALSLITAAKERELFNIIVEHPGIADAEIATAMGVTLGTVKKLKFRVRQKLSSLDSR